ncbi:hypothetical protein [Actinoplanes sp. DH11]|uniref:hypothetical protein n=1 Tax=Actinoplanes sp. DH11 TaxID=2857011 RepID=UPI001E4F5D6F|nr:hypothetical protein [Actinoplanes sp. DH11]
MYADLLKAVMVLLPVLVGAAAAAVPTVLVERSRQRVVLDTRWDVAIQNVSANFATSARALLDLAEQHAKASEAEQKEVLERMTMERGRLHMLMAEVRILTDHRVQLAARRVVRHTWALQALLATGTDPRATDFPYAGPRERTLSSLFDFYRAVRRQLRVPHADELASLNPPVVGERS